MGGALDARRALGEVAETQDERTQRVTRSVASFALFYRRALLAMRYGGCGGTQFPHEDPASAERTSVRFPRA